MCTNNTVKTDFRILLALNDIYIYIRGMEYIYHILWYICDIYTRTHIYIIQRINSRNMELLEKTTKLGRKKKSQVK